VIKEKLFIMLDDSGSRESEDGLKVNQRRLYQAKDLIFPDITFKVEGQEIKAHKNILYVGCKFFENMFTSSQLVYK
jgi:hypothetical protein